MADHASRPKRILVAPLDWGLGHATRCIPLIRELRALGCEVLIGADGAPAELLGQEFPELEQVPLPGYGIRYQDGASGFGFRMITQLPSIRSAIRRENRTLRDWLTRHPLDAIISDNRFGLHSPGIPSVLVTHQLEIRSPFGEVSQGWLRRANYHYIQRFDGCWVVDFPGTDNLAGELSHPQKLPRVPVTYLGCLSRFSPDTRPTRLDLTVIVSGPEPQRTHFARMVSAQLRGTSLNALVVQGLPGEGSAAVQDGTVRTVPHLSAGKLNEALLESALVLCRAGYSSIMDLVRLDRKAILIPTPGQTEQEYLAKYLMERGYFLSAPQQGFQLQEALARAAEFPFHKPDLPAMDTYRGVLKTFVSSL